MLLIGMLIYTIHLALRTRGVLPHPYNSVILAVILLVNHITAAYTTGGRQRKGMQILAAIVLLLGGSYIIWTTSQ